MSSDAPRTQTVSPRATAIEHLLSEACMWALVSGIMLIVLGMTTNVQNGVVFMPLKVWTSGLFASIAILVAATALRNKANSRENGALWHLLAIVAALFPLVIALYLGLYVGAFLLVNDVTTGHFFMAGVRVLVCGGSFFIFRDTLRLLLRAKHFTLNSPRIDSVISALKGEASVKAEQ